MQRRRSIRRIVFLVASMCGGTVVACSNESAPDPSVPQLLAPVAGAILDNGCVPEIDSIVWDFDWSDVAGATEYHLFVRNAGDVFAIINDSTITESSYHLSRATTYTGLTTDWVWWVRARVDGTFHDWGGPRGFNVEDPNTDCPAA
jgi:hypothetical protein